MIILRCPSSIYTWRAKDDLFKGVWYLWHSAGCKRESKSRRASGGNGSQLYSRLSRKMVLLHIWCSIEVRCDSFLLAQITKLQERGKLSGRSMLESLLVFSRCISGSNDLCRCCLSYSNSKVIISEWGKSFSWPLPFHQSFVFCADSHLCSILSLKFRWFLSLM